jgi:hypothetical protein
MAGSYSIANTKEVVKLAKLVTIRLMKGLKSDGKFELDDLVTLLADPEVVIALTVAVEGIEKVPLEAKELDWKEGLELGKYVYDAVAEVLAAVKN